MATKKEKPAPKRRGVDWDAVERDYRTGAFTLRELADKYGCSHQAVGKQVKAKGWTQDLSKAVRQATNAKLIEAEVAKQVAESGQAVANSVLAAAEVNTQVVLRHRTRLEQLNKDADAAREKLAALCDTVADVREAATLVSAIESLSRTTKNLIEKEREAFGLDEKVKPGEGADAPAMGEAEAATRLQNLLAKYQS